MKMIGKSMTLEEGEQEVCKKIAQMRHTKNRMDSIVNKKIGNQSDEFTDLNGIGAELAFCKLFNLYPDLTIYIRSSANGDDLGDCKLNGKLIDVKATVHEHGRLLTVPWKKPTVYAFALMVGTFPEYSFRGFLMADELINEDRLGRMPGSSIDSYFAEQEELVEFDELEVYEWIK
jgi:hypothetical protein